MKPSHGRQGEGLAAAGLGRAYGARTVLSDLTWRLQPGEMLAVTGPNGAGKTTLLRMLAGVSRPTTGEVFLDGVSLSNGPAHIRRRIGYVGHQPMLFADLTGRENLLFFGRLYNAPRERIDELLAAVDMDRRADLPVHSCSRGMQQRLAVARALLHRPHLLICDEPLTGLDRAGQVLVLQLLEGHLAGGGMAVVAGHDRQLTAGAHLVLELGMAPDDWTMERRAPAGLYSPGGAAASPESAQGAAGAGVPHPAEGERTANPAEAPLPGFFSQWLTLTGADLVGAFRNLAGVATVPLFAVLVLLVFGLTLRPGDRDLDPLLPALLWTALAFAALSAQLRPFIRERALGAVEGLKAAPVDGAAAYMARLTANWLVLLAVAAVMTPLFFSFLGWQGPPVPGLPMAGIVTVGTFTVSTVAVAAAALSVQGRGAEGLLSLLALPFLLPVLMSVVMMTEGLLQGRPPAEWQAWFRLLLACGIVFSMFPALLHDYLMEV